MKIDKIIEQRIQRIILISEATTKKIIEKEFKKLKKDIIRGIIKNDDRID